MAKKEENKAIVLSEEHKKKITLIKHYMAEKGLDGSAFDRAFDDAVNSAIETMYKKYVPAPVRNLFKDTGLSLVVEDNKDNKKEVTENE